MLGVEPQQSSRIRGVSPTVPGAFHMRRPKVRGKFLYVADEKFWIRGVTYGTFRPDAHGDEYHNPETVERDFALMAENGLNTVRTYTVPPRWLLDTAQRYGLRVMVGLPWEQHITFLDDAERARAIEKRIRLGVRACAGHAAVLCYAVGNEIPASIVRWHGKQRVERYLERLYRAAKAEDPEGLVTYVNYPTTEYLQLPFLDLVCFNVYLEAQERFATYLARLQNIAGDRPLIMGEIGLDSRQHGAEVQAQMLDWQVRTAFAAGCAGAFVFAWTDEWYRGGYEIADWDFGLTDRQRQPKPALTSVRNAFAEVPFPKDSSWPRISVVVCTYNGARTIRDCFEGLLQLEYPNFEVIVVDDGSTDTTAAIARQYGFRLISTENRGLSSARNTGMQAAMGDIVAYIDDDAYPDPHWLTYLAAAFMATDHVGIGGPNLAPPGDGPIADCVANAPGGPVHVLLSDREAEHIPGCNMAFRKTALQAIGGFDAQFRTAGDDVDVCWRLQQRGWTLGFSATAMVWHHRRNSIRAYWRQQQGYGKAEALLEKKWPEKYNVVGTLFLGWPTVWERCSPGLTLVPRAYLSGDMGECVVPISVSTCAQSVRIAAVDARMVLCRRRSRPAVGVGLPLDPVVVGAAVVGAGCWYAAGASRCQCKASVIHQSATLPSGLAGIMEFDDGAASAATTGTSARTSALWSDALEARGGAWVGVALDTGIYHLARAVAECY